VNPLNRPSPLTARALCTTLCIAATLCLGVASAQTATGTPLLSFKDFYRTPIGPRGLEMTDTLRQAHGQPVRLVGYMVQQEAPTPGQFLLTPRPVQMSEHADGEADDLPPATVLVYLPDGGQTWAIPHAQGLVEVSGELQVGRHEAADGRIHWVRLRLASPERVAHAPTQPQPSF
jgi:hypothetical protein